MTSIFKRSFVLNLYDLSSECEEPPRLNVPTELSIFSEVPSQIYENLDLHNKTLAGESLQANDKFGMIAANYMKKAILPLKIKKSELKYVCINVYKIKTIRLLIDKFHDHFSNVYNKRLRLKGLLKCMIFSATTNDELTSKIEVLKCGITILEVYAIMKYLQINCVLFDKHKTIQYTLSEFNEAVMVFRFNNSLDLDYAELC